MWTATISGKQLNSDGLTVTLSFSDGTNSFTKSFTTSSVDDNWLEDQVRATIENLQNLATYSDGLTIGEDVNTGA